MLAKRIIPCLDVDAGRVVKGIRFVSLVDAGDPVEQGKRYDLEGADELTFLDITASSDKRAIVAGLVRRVADEVFIPLCVGMQMLFEESEEFGTTRGLGFLRGRVRRFPEGLRVPQVGWNQVVWAGPHSLAEGIEDGAFFYFVHSFYCEASEAAAVVGQTEYGIDYPSVVARANVCGVQFHPEKSQAAGLRLLKNFAEA